MMNLNPCTVNRLAGAFIQHLRDAIGDDTVDHIARLDLEFHDPRTCYSHDYCDANMVMVDAFEAAMGREIEIGDDADTALWNAAWNHARALHYGAPVEHIRLEVAA